MKPDRSGGGGARGGREVVARRGWGARWVRIAAVRGALPVALLAGGCGDAAPDRASDTQTDDAPARPAPAETTSGSASLPPSAGLAIPDTMEAVRSSEPGTPDEPRLAEADAESARRVIRDYYAAIAAGNYERAYGMWEDGGRRSGQTFLEFAAGFAGTERVQVQAGAPGRLEGAAGSRYVEVPVVVGPRNDPDPSLCAQIA